MTGFGAGESASDSVRVRVELRSVNGRGLKVSARLPSALDAHAHALETRLRAALARGNVSLGMTLERLADAAPSRIAESVVAEYLAQARRVGAAVGLEGDPSWESLLRLPGTVESAEESGLTDEDVATATAALDCAVVDLILMREREGLAMAEILLAGIDEVERLAAHVRERVPAALEDHRIRLSERLTKLLEGRADTADAVPDDVLAREMALLADKTDVAEEVDRLGSHVEQWREALASGGPIGRRLDFLAQELGREANTIASKSADGAITRAALDLKLAIERLKEQAANVE